MIERFTMGVRHSILFARYEASQLGDLYIEPEHLLLGIIDQKKEPVLKGDLKKSVVLKHFPSNIFCISSGYSTELPLACATKKILVSAYYCAEQNRNQYVGVPHLLYAILTLQDPSLYRLADVLLECGITLKDTRARFAPLIEIAR